MAVVLAYSIRSPALRMDLTRRVALVLVNSNLYGWTTAGGAGGGGTLFALSVPEPSTSASTRPVRGCSCYCGGGAGGGRCMFHLPRCAGVDVVVRGEGPCG